MNEKSIRLMRLYGFQEASELRDAWKFVGKLEGADHALTTAKLYKNKAFVELFRLLRNVGIIPRYVTSVFKSKS